MNTDPSREQVRQKFWQPQMVNQHQNQAVSQSELPQQNINTSQQFPNYSSQSLIGLNNQIQNPLGIMLSSNSHNLHPPLNQLVNQNASRVQFPNAPSLICYPEEIPSKAIETQILQALQNLNVYNSNLEEKIRNIERSQAKLINVTSGLAQDVIAIKKEKEKEKGTPIVTTTRGRKPRGGRRGNGRRNKNSRRDLEINKEEDKYDSEEPE